MSRSSPQSLKKSHNLITFGNGCNEVPNHSSPICGYTIQFFPKQGNWMNSKKFGHRPHQPVNLQLKWYSSSCFLSTISQQNTQTGQIALPKTGLIQAGFAVRGDRRCHSCRYLQPLTTCEENIESTFGYGKFNASIHLDLLLGSLLPFCLDSDPKSIVLTNQRAQIQNTSPNSEREPAFGRMRLCIIWVVIGFCFLPSLCLAVAVIMYAFHLEG
jgi:hypothetical protein